mgnify:CR=1 FL=1
MTKLSRQGVRGSSDPSPSARSMDLTLLAVNVGYGL